jgi:hypothetical protein
MNALDDSTTSSTYKTMNSELPTQSGAKLNNPNCSKGRTTSFQNADISDSAIPVECEDSRAAENDVGSAKQPSPKDAVGDGDTVAASPQTTLMETKTKNDAGTDQQEEDEYEVRLRSPLEQQQRQPQTQQLPHTRRRSTPQNEPLTDRDQDNWNDFDRVVADDDDDDDNGDQDENDAGDGDESEATASDFDSDDDNMIWKFRLTCGKLVNNEYVQVSIIVLIILNALMMGVGTFDFVTDNPEIETIFNRVDKAFLVVFTIEVGMQLIYLGVALFADGWLFFDFLIVVLSWSFEQLQVVRAFRIFRAFRLITRVKPLRDLVLAIGAVLPRMYAIGSLLVLVFYIYSVLFTELFKHLDLSENYFKTLDASLFTCMEMMTLEWGETSREVMDVYSWAWAPFLSFIALTGFIVFNLIVAVVCDAVAVTEKTVRQLEGIESDNPTDKLEQAQERIDLLQDHISDMLRTQQAVQDMIEVLAGEMLHLDAELRMSEQRETDLRIEVDRRKSYQKSMESSRQIQSFDKSDKRDSHARLRRMGSGSEMTSPRTFRRRLLVGDDGSRASARSSSRRNLLDDSGSEHKPVFRRSDSRRQLISQSSQRQLNSSSHASKASNRSLDSDL